MKTPLSAVCLALVVLCMAFAGWAGQDMNWDLANYHYYVAHAFLNDRLGRDFMAASVQSYLNPMAYLPFYWMVHSGWHSIAAGLVLAAIHSLNLVLLALICSKAFFRQREDSTALIVLAALLGAATPVFLAQIGSTFIDATTSIGVLLCLYLLVLSTEPARRGALWTFAGGVAMGIAAGCKLSNAVFAIAAVAFFPVAFSASAGRARLAVTYGLGTACGLVVAHGYWGLKLYGEFGNPFFPFLNQFFRSPDFPAAALKHARFIPDSPLDALTLPFRMADMASWTYTETMAPDLRFAVLAMLAAAVAAKRMWPSRSAVFEAGAAGRPSMGIVAFFLLSIPLWVVTSGNGRYAMPLMLLAGPVLVRWFRDLTGPRGAIYLSAALLLAQGIHISQVGNPRWAHTAWREKWLDVEVPQRLSERPYLYLILGMQPNAYVVPFLHKDSAFVNVIGQHSVSPDGPGGGRLEKLLIQYQGRIRMLTQTLKDPSPQPLPDPKAIALINALLERLDLAIDPRDCVKIRPLESALDADRADRPDRLKPAPSQARGALSDMLSCGLRPTGPADARFAQARSRMSRVFDRIEASCPKLFGPPGPALEHSLRAWERYYLNTDITVVVVDEQVFYSRAHSMTDVDLGTVSEWESGRGRVRCEK